jgi:hypothetical protein
LPQGERRATWIDRGGRASGRRRAFYLSHARPMLRLRAFCSRDENALHVPLPSQRWQGARPLFDGDVGRFLHRWARPRSSFRVVLSNPQDQRYHRHGRNMRSELMLRHEMDDG